MVHSSHLQTVALPFEGGLPIPGELHSLRRLVSVKGAVQLSPGLKDRPSGPAPGLTPHTSHFLAPLSPMLRLQADICEQQGLPACWSPIPPHPLTLFCRGGAWLHNSPLWREGVLVCCPEKPPSTDMPCLCHLKHAVQQAARQVSRGQAIAAFTRVHAVSQAGQKLGHLLLGRPAALERGRCQSAHWPHT